MRNEKGKPTTILAIDPTVRGFGFIIFEGVKNPLDWGRANIRFQKNSRSLKKISKLVNFYQPSVIVIEEMKGSQRHKRIRNLITRIEKLADIARIKVRKYPRSQVQDVFSQFGASTKYEIAKLISQWFPELEQRLPPKREPWMPEDERYGIFDAAALGLTYYYVEE